MKKLGLGIVSLFLVQALVAACGDDGSPGPGTPSGACCDGSQCTVVPQTMCTTGFQGVDTTCGTNTCSGGANGACYRGATCTMTTQAMCMNTGDEFSPGGMCPPPS